MYYAVGEINPRIGSIYRLNMFETLDMALDFAADLDMCDEIDYEIIPMNSEGQRRVLNEFVPA